MQKTQDQEMGVFITMIASGPVIVQEKGGVKKILLVKEGTKPIDELKWKFCGGRLKRGETLRETAIREAKEEIGIEVKLIADLPVIELWNEVPESSSEKPELMILVHYLAEITDEPKAGEEVKAMKWFDINNLPDNCAPNVKPIIEATKRLI
ncbi:NUDIX hydrolase [Patescibacteria group bacterium]|nr:NUDIX hydrolase [Patescibacteria group bacterium]